MTARIWKFRGLYLILLPTLLYFFVFSYIPYAGMAIAFQKFSATRGIFGSEWVGLYYFKQLFQMDEFYQVVRNTLVLNFYKIAIAFPAPIAFALLLHEIGAKWFKRSIQTITYFPHFLSWAVFGGIMLTFLVPGGAISKLVESLGGDGSSLLTDTSLFRGILVASATLKSFGFGTVVYLAALTGIDPSQYEAARMDGANRWKQMRYVTLPGMKSVIVLMFILELGYIMDGNFDQVFIMYNPSVYEVADIVDTYVYRIGLGNAEYSIATAIGIFKGIVGFVLILAANTIIKKMKEPSLW